MGFWSLDTATDITNKPKPNFGNFLSNIAPLAGPILGTIAQNVLSGINTRKARLYDSPKEQVKRFQEAGLPMASTSRITTGGGFTTQANIPDPSPSIQANLGASLKREIDRKQIELARESIRSAQASADIAKGEAENKLNPTGVFQPTNQGMSMMLGQGIEKNALNTAEITNKYLPLEKDLNLTKGNKEIDKIVQDTINSAAQYNVIVSEGEIKRIMSNWEERMSKQKFDLLVKQNTGLQNANEISNLQGDIMRATKMAQIQEGINKAIRSGQELAANQMNLLLQNLETEAAKNYYRVRARADRSYNAGREGTAFTPADLMYLGMFSPKQSTMTAGQLLSMIPK